MSDARVADRAPGGSSGAAHHWRLELPEVPATVLADPTRIQQVLVNLLANARTHTPPGTTVTVRVRQARGDLPWVTLEVEDDGPGIPAELQPHVFERFARGDASRSRHAGSTGLGLAIVQAVAAAHGGLAEVRSAPGDTVFAVHLPADAVYGQGTESSDAVYGQGTDSTGEAYGQGTDGSGEVHGQGTDSSAAGDAFSSRPNGFAHTPVTWGNSVESAPVAHSQADHRLSTRM